MSQIVELSDISILNDYSRAYLKIDRMVLSQGDICHIQSKSKTDKIHLFLRLLSTLVAPSSGIYFFKGDRLDFSDYRKLLPIKLRIGYIGQDASMLSNRTIRENLKLMDFYRENSLETTLDPRVNALCEKMGIADKLDLRPWELDKFELRIAVYIRELSKKPDLIIIEKPEGFISHVGGYNVFRETLEAVDLKKIATVIASYDYGFVHDFTNRDIAI